MFRLAFACLSLVCAVTAWPAGAPPTTCSSLMPNHGAEPQNKIVNPPPYTIAINGLSTVEQGGSVSITLGGGSGPGFKGFIIVAEALDNDNQRYRAGKFTSSSSMAKSACDDSTGFTHNSNIPKSTLEIQWVAPTAPFTGSVNFWGTFVQSKTTYWIELKGSTQITVVAPTTTVSTTTTSTTRQTTPTTPNENTPATKTPGTVVQTNPTQARRSTTRTTGGTVLQPNPTPAGSGTTRTTITTKVPTIPPVKLPSDTKVSSNPKSGTKTRVGSSRDQDNSGMVAQISIWCLITIWLHLL